MFDVFAASATVLFIAAGFFECLVAKRFKDPTPLIWAMTALAAAPFPMRELHWLDIHATKWVLGFSLIASVGAAWRAWRKAFP